MTDLQGKVAFVTGAGSGIGASTAVLFARAGADLALVDLSAEQLADTAQAVEGMGRQALSLVADVASSSEVQAAVDNALGAFDRIDVGVNVAGVSGRAPLLEMSDAEWERVIRVNLFGTFHVCRAVGRAMAARSAGTLVNVASSRAFIGLERAAHYAASKAGVVSLTYSVAEELRPHGIRVNVVVPGATDTPLYRGLHSLEAQVEHRRKALVAPPESMARLILFLASSASEPLTGQAMGWVHRYS